jgi:hypothetical protein
VSARCRSWVRVYGDYQVIDRACANGVDEANEELDQEDGDE